MAVERVIALFKAAKSDVALKNKIQNSLSKEAFIEMASGEGYQFNEDELNLILKIVKQTSLNPCSLEQVSDDSSDYLESGEDDTNDADSSKTESLSLRGNINRFKRASLDINIVLSESISIAVDSISGYRYEVDSDSISNDMDDTRRSAGSRRIRRLALGVNIDLSEPHSWSWTNDRSLIKSILKK
jgi:predicted ribosomally synthesized peptide with nif11-like leader